MVNITLGAKLLWISVTRIKDGGNHPLSRNTDWKIESDVLTTLQFVTLDLPSGNFFGPPFASSRKNFPGYRKCKIDSSMARHNHAPPYNITKIERSKRVDTIATKFFAA
jgi:hypothetical protein